MSRPYQARSCATSTISATPPSTSAAHLGLDRVDRARALLAPERRDRAERARPVAALGHLHVRPGRGGRRTGQLEQVPDPGGLAAPEDHLGEAALPGEPDDRVGLGKRLGQLGPVPLGHAPGDDEAGAGRFTSASARATSIDSCRAASTNAHVLTTIRSASSARSAGREPVGEERGDHLVGVDGVLRAAQGLDVEPGGHHRILPVRLSVDSRR